MAVKHEQEGSEHMAFRPVAAKPSSRKNRASGQRSPRPKSSRAVCTSRPVNTDSRYSECSCRKGIEAFASSRNYLSLSPQNRGSVRAERKGSVASFVVNLTKNEYGAGNVKSFVKAVAGLHDEAFDPDLTYGEYCAQGFEDGEPRKDIDPATSMLEVLRMTWSGRPAKASRSARRRTRTG